jgi:hypothetical protein
VTEEPAKHTRRARRAIGRVEKALAAELQPGETIEAAAYAQRWIPFLQALLLFGAIGDTLYIVIAKPYYVAASSSRFFLVNAARLWPAAKGKVLDAPLGETRIEQLRGGPLRRQFRVTRLGGSDYRLSVHRAYRRELERLESLVGS